MSKKQKNRKTIGTTEDLINAFRKASRDAELERNGGRWAAKDRPHKNKKKYDRKRERKNLHSLFVFSELFYQLPALSSAATFSVKVLTLSSSVLNPSMNVRIRNPIVALLYMS